MKKERNLTNMWFKVVMIALSITAWNQHKQIKAMEVQIDNFLSYDFSIDTIVDLEEQVDKNTKSISNLVDVFRNVNDRLEPRNLAEDPETNWTIVYEELAKLKSSYRDLHHEFYEEYFDAGQDTTDPLYSRIDAVYNDDILALFNMYNNLYQAICQIEPENLLCTQ